MTTELGDDELDEMIAGIREQLAKPQDAPLMIEAKVNGDDTPRSSSASEACN